jgi:hypothetical protein
MLAKCWSTFGCRTDSNIDFALITYLLKSGCTCWVCFLAYTLFLSCNEWHTGDVPMISITDTVSIPHQYLSFPFKLQILNYNAGVSNILELLVGLT